MIRVLGANPAMDRTHLIENLRGGEVNRVSSTRVFAGGKGLDVARTVRKLGVPVAAYGFLGGDIGVAVRRACRTAGIEDKHTEIKGETRVCNIYVEPNTKRVTVVNEKGPTVSEQEQEQLINLMLADVQDGDFLVLSGSLPEGVPDSFYGRIIRELANKKVYTIVDATGNVLKEAIAARPWMIKPNIYEFKQAFTSVKDGSDLYTEIQSVLKDGISNVIVTLGDQGCLAANAVKTFYVRVPKVDVVSPIASGDTLVGGFVAKYVESHDFEEAVRFANACAVANALNPMPELPSDCDLKELTDLTTVEVAG